MMNQEHRELRDDELNTVSGGAFPIVHVQVAMLNACIEGIENAVLNPQVPYDGPGVCEIPPRG
jgi:hypothetical protein